MIELFPKQISFYDACRDLENTGRQNIAHGSVRSGKTWVTVYTWCMYIMIAPPGDLIMIGRTLRSIERNVLTIMFQLLGNAFDYKSGRGFATFMGRVIYIEGASDKRSENKIRGMTVAGAYVDEITLINEDMYKMLLSRMSVKDAKLFGSTNPDSPYHYLKKDYLDVEGLDLRSFYFNIDDNIFLDDTYVKNIKLEYRGLFYKRFIQGLWTMAEGAIYDFFDEDEHVITECPIAEKYSVAVDYGIGNPTVFLLMGRNRFTWPKYWCEREFFWDSKEQNRQKTDDEYAEDFINFVEGKKISEVIIDPSALSFIVALRKKGISNVIDADNSVLDGIRHQSTMLVSGKYKIHERCENTIKEYYGYIWDSKQQDKGEDKPLKISDHTKDGERYYLYTVDQLEPYNF